MPTTSTVRRYTNCCKCLLTGIAFAVSGCSDPNASRLDPGAKVTVINPKSDHVMLEGSRDPWPFVPQGSDAVVVSDADPEGGEHRKVVVVVKGGEKDGAQGGVPRHYLKPR